MKEIVQKPNKDTVESKQRMFNIIDTTSITTTAIYF